MHQSAFGGRALPGPAGELKRSPRRWPPIAAKRGPTLRGGDGRERGKGWDRRGRKGRGGKGGGGRERGREGREEEGGEGRGPS